MSNTASADIDELRTEIKIFIDYEKTVEIQATKHHSLITAQHR